MTTEKEVKEALEELKLIRFDHNVRINGTNHFSETLDIAIKAVNKAIPQQVELIGDGYDPDGNLVYDYAQCPNCQRAFEETDDSWECGYCPCCGQALNWWDKESEDEE